MTLRRLAILQWLGLFVGAFAWSAQHVIGFGITQAECGAGGAGWGIGNDVWQGALMGASALCVVLALAASTVVVFATRWTSYRSEPPPSRIRFFGMAAMLANLLFLFIILLDGFASIYNVTCRQS
jgi:hypothetical protein